MQIVIFLCLFVRDTEYGAKIAKNIVNKYFACANFYLLCNVFPQRLLDCFFEKLGKLLIIHRFTAFLYLLQRDTE